MYYTGVYARTHTHTTQAQIYTHMHNTHAIYIPVITHYMYTILHRHTTLHYTHYTVHKHYSIWTHYITYTHYTTHADTHTTYVQIHTCSAAVSLVIGSVTGYSDLTVS